MASDKILRVLKHVEIFFQTHDGHPDMLLTIQIIKRVIQLDLPAWKNHMDGPDALNRIRTDVKNNKLFRAFFGKLQSRGKRNIPIRNFEMFDSYVMGEATRSQSPTPRTVSPSPRDERMFALLVSAGMPASLPTLSEEDEISWNYELLEVLLAIVLMIQASWKIDTATVNNCLLVFVATDIYKNFNPMKIIPKRIKDAGIFLNPFKHEIQTNKLGKLASCFFILQGYKLIYGDFTKLETTVIDQWNGPTAWQSISLLGAAASLSLSDFILNEFGQAVIVGVGGIFPAIVQFVPYLQVIGRFAVNRRFISRIKKGFKTSQDASFTVLNQLSSGPYKGIAESLIDKFEQAGRGEDPHLQHLLVTWGHRLGTASEFLLLIFKLIGSGAFKIVSLKAIVGMTTSGMFTDILKSVGDRFSSQRLYWNSGWSHMADAWFLLHILAFHTIHIMTLDALMGISMYMCQKRDGRFNNFNNFKKLFVRSSIIHEGGPYLEDLSDEDEKEARLRIARLCAYTATSMSAYMIDFIPEWLDLPSKQSCRSTPSGLIGACMRPDPTNEQILKQLLVPIAAGVCSLTGTAVAFGSINLGITLASPILELITFMGRTAAEYLKTRGFIPESESENVGVVTRDEGMHVLFSLTNCVTKTVFILKGGPVLGIGLYALATWYVEDCGMHFDLSNPPIGPISASLVNFGREGTSFASGGVFSESRYKEIVLTNFPKEWGLTNVSKVKIRLSQTKEDPDCTDCKIVESVQYRDQELQDSSIIQFPGKWRFAVDWLSDNTAVLYTYFNNELNRRPALPSQNKIGMTLKDRGGSLYYILLNMARGFFDSAYFDINQIIELNSNWQVLLKRDAGNCCGLMCYINADNLKKIENRLATDQMYPYGRLSILVMLKMLMQFVKEKDPTREFICCVDPSIKIDIKKGLTDELQILYPGKYGVRKLETLKDRIMEKDYMHFISDLTLTKLKSNARNLIPTLTWPGNESASISFSSSDNPIHGIVRIAIVQEEVTEYVYYVIFMDAVRRERAVEINGYLTVGYVCYTWTEVGGLSNKSRVVGELLANELLVLLDSKMIPENVLKKDNSRDYILKNYIQKTLQMFSYGESKDTIIEALNEQALNDFSI